MAGDVRRGRVDVVTLVASAGGLQAFSTVLRDLPPALPAAIVVQQHLGGRTSALATILAKRSEHSVHWAIDGQRVDPGRVVVCPPGRHLELLPDGSCSLRELAVPFEPRFDVLLSSMASSYGPRGLAVVLTGSGRDGSEGTIAMKRAGGVVIAQSQEPAEYPSMPKAAAEAGADLVVPIDEIGRVIVQIVAGEPLCRFVRHG